MSKRLVLLGLALALLPAQARLGETEDQLVSRYGAVFKRDTGGDMNLPMLCFMKNGYFIGVFMLDGKCAMEMFKQQDDGSNFSDNEIDTILQADAAGQKWTKQDAVSVKTVWTRDDGAQAQYDPIQHSLAIISKDYLAASSAAEKKSEDQKLNGF